MWWWRAWLLAGAAALVGYFLVPGDRWYSNAYYDAIGLASAAAILVGVRLHRPARPRLWYCFAAGQATWSLGDAAFGYYEYALKIAPFPSAADGIYLAGYPMLIGGLFVLIRGRTSGRDRAGLLDAAIIATGLALLAWTFLIRPITVDTTLAILPRLITLAYPTADLLMLVMLVRLLTTPGSRTASFRLLAGALLLVLTADIGYNLLTTFASYDGGAVDAGWLGSYMLWAAAALHPSMRSLSEVAPDRAPRFTQGRLVLLAATSLLAPALLFWQGLRHPATVDWAGIGVGAVVLFLLVLARMSGLIVQVQDQASQLAALAHNDSLTGVPNRRAWDLELAREMAIARRNDTPIAVALLDLDHFKRFNDRHGHQAGDRLLTQAAALWRSHLRDHDIIARYGGEEFGLIFPGLTAEQASHIIDRLHAATPDGQTFSAGTATWNRIEPPEALVNRADKALYQAKHDGRNRTNLAEPPQKEPAPPIGAPVPATTQPLGASR